MKLRGFVIAGLLVGPSIASADHPRQLVYRSGEAPLYGFVAETRSDGAILARQVLPASTAPPISETVNVPAIAQSRLVYLNKSGVTLQPGTNDSRTNRSTVVKQQTTFGGWSANATTWTETVTCIRELFAPFDMRFVETNPGNVPHIEAVFGGTPALVGLPSIVKGVSPFLENCAIIENSIVFTFTNANSFTSRQACEIMAQEIAHSYGLDHELLASDPMTYLQYTGNRAFQDQTASCGESTARPCGINGSTCRANQNSVALLRARLGVAATDMVTPTLSWDTPANDEVVPPGFEVNAAGEDNVAITSAVLRIDGEQVDMKEGAGPFVFTTSPALADGQHTIIVEISDGRNVKSETRTVTVKSAAAPDNGSGDDNNDIVGGCAAGGRSGVLFALGLLLALAIRRRG